MAVSPQFESWQDRRFVFVKVDVPDAKDEQYELEADGREFRFALHPYELQIVFAHEVVADGREDVSFEPPSVTVRLLKRQEGCFFEDLKVLALLSGSSAARNRPQNALVEVLSSTYAASGEIADDEKGDNSSSFSEEVDALTTTVEATKLTRSSYGFNDCYSGYFEDHCTLEISVPDTLPEGERRPKRIMREDEKFDPEHYAADFAEPEIWEIALVYRLNDGLLSELTEPEYEALERLPDRKLDLKIRGLNLLSNLSDIVFAYLYELRATSGEMTVESAWTISRISATLSWLETFHSPQEAIQASFRRSLAYPLFRSFQLSQLVLADVKRVFAAGRPALLRCLLHLKNIFDSEDEYRVLSEIFIVDYCIWIKTIE
mmetsp:Transcript_6916/g.21032  ORF Transcript_6916/g.21032 Transcript_6916/m.21032 type:complete len:375 (-) Transcript_6916:1130-2254(-)